MAKLVKVSETRNESVESVSYDAYSNNGAYLGQVETHKYRDQTTWQGWVRSLDCYVRSAATERECATNALRAVSQEVSYARERTSSLRDRPRVAA